MAFKIGDTIGFLYEQGKGVIVSLEPDSAIALVEVDGIEIPYSINDLIDLKEIKVHPITLPKDINSDIKKSIKKEKVNVPDTIDLHIENLLNSHLHMSNGEILQYQMNVFKDYMRRIENKMMRKVFVIHGVGEGVLKEEVRFYLSHFDRYEFTDAPYHMFGYGATEIRIYYNY